MVDLATVAEPAKKGRAIVSSGRVAMPEDGVVHLWQFAAPLRSPTTAQIEVLSDEEIAKADNFRLGEHRVRYLWRRVILRDVLAGYGERSAAEHEYASAAKESAAVSARVAALEQELAELDDPR